MFQVVEKFVSINGEGPNAGRIAAFIRFAGCNLNCSYCDTGWANEKDAPFQEESISQLCDYVRKQGVRFVTLTGGEPLLQKEICKLTEALLDIEGLTIEFETNGSISLEELDTLRKEKNQQDRICFTMDYKLPGSGMQQAMRTGNFSFLRKQDTVKFVAGSREDLDTMKEMVKTCGLGNRCHVYVSPVFGRIEPAHIVDYIIEEQLHEVTMQIQMHKFIWEPDKRGV
ncbi:MAG: putative 7-carboxy-7-deazaguanine synthase QueE [Lachnospiraceae bacterium]